LVRSEESGDHKERAIPRHATFIDVRLQDNKQPILSRRDCPAAAAIP
jgi:hypothetical protein